jgi:putative transposase
VRIREKSKYLCRVVDKAGAPVDFLLAVKRDRKAALRFLRKPSGRNGIPSKITIDNNGANAATIES